MSRIDSSHPLPLYAQIAEELRARIEVGELLPGDFLEPLREAASKYQVNLHTVRHAYAALARQGLVRTSKPKGTEVIAGPSPSLDETLERFVNCADDQHHLDARGLIEELSRWVERRESKAIEISVLECSFGQCLDLAGQIEAIWDVRCRPAALHDLQELPSGSVVATPFHFNDLRVRWPEHLARINFVTTSPDAGLRGRLEAQLHAQPRPLLLVANDEPTVKVIAADLAAVLPGERFALETCIVESAGEALTKNADALVLLPPSQWEQLTEEERRDPRAILVRYLFDPDELRNLGIRLGWPRRNREYREKVS